MVGTDGSKISFMGIPTPNIFAGGENMHGRFEYVSLQTMERAVDTIIGIVTKNKKKRIRIIHPNPLNIIENVPKLSVGEKC